MRTFLVSARLLVSVVGALTVVLALFAGGRFGALEAQGAGSGVAGRVFVDFNMNGLKTDGDDLAVATDTGLAGVEVKAYDSTGKLVGTTTSGDGGSYNLLVSGAAGTQLRVEFSTPSGYEPSFVATGTTSENNSSVQFVSDGATGVDYAVEKPGNYCQDNPDIVTCFAPNGGNPSADPSDPGALRFSSRMTPLQFDSGMASAPGWPANEPSPTYTTQDPDVVGSLTKLGSVFGIGIDRDNNVFFGTYVKRHSTYGQAGATNTIYRRNLATGDADDVETFLTLPGTLPAHAAANPADASSAPPYGTDGRRNIGSGPAYSNVWTKAGRIGLGDVDVSPDGKTLYAVDMEESAPLLYTVPLTGSGASVAPGDPVSVPIPRPTPYDGTDCVGTWHPMGIGLRAGSDGILVGGVCGAETTVGGSLAGMPAACKTTDAAFDPSACTTATSPYGQLIGGRTVVRGYVLEYSGGAWSTVASIPFDQKRAASGTGPTNYSPWSYQSGLWRAWTDAKLNTVDPGDDPSGMTAWAAPQPMISNIEITDSGSLILGIRDRWQDKRGGPESISYESTVALGDPLAGLPISGGDLIRLCPSGDGRFNVESGGNCGSEIGSNNADMASAGLGYGGQTFYFNGFGAPTNSFGISHPTTALGSTATLPGSSAVWTSAYDVSSFEQQGIRALGKCPPGSTDCAPDNGGIGSQKAGIDWGSSYGWSKGNGLADLEMLCDKAPVQVGNRLWIDTDKDGIQDPGEKVVAGVTVRLYNSSATLVGTAITDPEGRYYFSSTLDKPAAGDGTSQGGGLKPDASFTVKLDNPADYAAGGPLHLYSLTKKDAGTNNAINSKASLSGPGAFGTESFPEIAIAARKPGENNHTFDAGFIGGPDPGPSPGSVTAPKISVAAGTCVDWGETKTVVISVRNRNSAALASRRVEAKVPKGFKVVGGTRGYFVKGGTVVWKNGTTAAGKTSRLRLRLQATRRSAARSRLGIRASGTVSGTSTSARGRGWLRVCHQSKPRFTG